MMKKPTRATAYHEAGHAVASWRLLLPFKHVSVVSDSDSLGHILSHRLRLTNEHVYTLSPQVRDRLERKIIVLLAGREAERLVSRRYYHRGARADDRQAIDLASHIAADNEITTYYRWLRIRTQNLVGTNAQAIKAVAEALLERRKMTGAETREVILGSFSFQKGGA